MRLPVASLALPNETERSLVLLVAQEHAHMLLAPLAYFADLNNQPIHHEALKSQ